MQIGKNTVVSLTYQLSGSEGNTIEQADQPLTYLHGGYDGIFPRVEQALEGREVGYACEVQLTPEDAFGEYEEELVRIEPRKVFPPNLKVGMQFEGSSEESGESRIYTVTDIAEDKVVVDGNHPLAGQTVVFSCTVTEVRAASAEELAHGHVTAPTAIITRHQSCHRKGAKAQRSRKGSPLRGGAIVAVKAYRDVGQPVRRQFGRFKLGRIESFCWSFAAPLRLCGPRLTRL